ncbi:MAG: plastocyanin/azurin family copper-binding protein [Thermoanaerobaculia bacterium]|nr:plastocyanin/azurin family copper-binding protein [Thermoanaerobaculia bacterium]
MVRPTLRILALPVALVCGLLLATAATAAPRVVKLKGTDNMQFDVKRLEAKAGEQLEVQLTTVSSMPKTEMAHNFILLAKNTPVDAFVMEAAMARATDYIPAGKKSFVLASTAMAGGGETVKVTFNVPTEPGEYTFICSFPGHYMAGMKGVLVVK